MQPVKFYFDFLNQSSRALYIFMQAAKIPFEAIPISMLKGEHLTGEYRDKVSCFRKLPAINDEGLALGEDMAIFRHLAREKIVPEHWYPRRDMGRSRIDEFVEWQQRTMGLACNNYFEEKWLVPFLHKDKANENKVSNAKERLDHMIEDFEQLFLKKKKTEFMVSDNISFADLVAVCEIDQPKAIGYDPFKRHVTLAKWYESVQKELGPHYREVNEEFEEKLKSSDTESYNQAMKKRNTYVIC